MNHAPRVSAEDGAIWRRILRLAFDHAIPPEQRDRTLKPYLRNPAQAGPAILAWAVRGCIAWQDSGLMVPECVKTATAQYREDSDPLAPFFKDCLLLGDGEQWTSWHEINEKYSDWCLEMGIKERFQVNQKRIKDKLVNNGCCRKKRHEGHGFTGVTLRDAFSRDFFGEQRNGGTECRE